MSQPRWADEENVGVNREPMHTPLRAHESLAQALAHGCGNQTAPTKWVIPLTPAKWLFHLAPSPRDAPCTRPGSGFDTETSTKAGGWIHIDVPLSWQLDPRVADQPMYTNYRYPFIDGQALLSNKFPAPRDDNPVGSYQHTFELPREWEGRRVLLQIDGADSAITVWVNGVEVGYSTDSCLPCEFDITAACSQTAEPQSPQKGARTRLAGEHVLSVQLLRWSKGSYMEDQDMWWLSGLHRHVRLLSKPRALALVDYAFTPTRAELSDDASEAHVGSAAFDLEVRLAGSGLGLSSKRRYRRVPHWRRR